MPTALTDALHTAAVRGEIDDLRRECESLYRSSIGRSLLDPAVQNQITNLLTAAALMASRNDSADMLAGIDDVLFPIDQTRSAVLVQLAAINHPFVKKTANAVASLSIRTQDAIFLALDQLLTPTRISA